MAGIYRGGQVILTAGDLWVTVWKTILPVYDAWPFVKPGPQVVAV